MPIFYKKDIPLTLTLTYITFSTVLDHRHRATIKGENGAAEMVQWLAALAALAEN